MAKMKRKELVKAETSLMMIKQGILWEPKFASRIKKATKPAQEELDFFHEEHIKIIKAHGGVEKRNPMTGRTNWQLVEPDVEDDWDDDKVRSVLDEFEKMEPAERQFILDELGERPDLWDEEGEVMYL